ncbi:hypothetical protein LXA43DRAFT_1092805 [Ganoderma leucocontextum]|nr:hypothetical protein LXA43DRAFT_1092805 [Ganoderma leucocontextum]
MESSTVPDSGPITDQEVLDLIQQGQPLAELLKELIFLRKWKDEQLKAQHQEAQRMERMLSRICENCKDTASRWTKHQNGSTDDLPVELLHTIFRFVFPPNTLLDPMSARGAHTPWQRAIAAKMTLAMVSRRWHSIALTFLYEEVTFRHLTQVRSFASALRTNPNLRHLAKKIVVDCPVTTEMRDVAVTDLVYILTQCTELRALAFTDNLFAMEDDLRRVALYHFPSVLAATVRALSGTLVRFEQWPQGGTPHFTWPISCVSAPHLTALAINVDHAASLERIELTSLEELDLSREYALPRGEDHSQRFVNWKLPRLKRLILPMATDIQGRVLQQFGESLTYLEFRDHLDMSFRWNKGPWKPYADYIHFCPALRHLVFQSSDIATLDELPSHPTLAYVDMWIHSPADQIRRDFVERRRHRRVARELRWKNVRLLDRALSSNRQLPELFPPDVPEEELPCVHTIPGLSITHAAWGVYGSDLDTLYPPENPMEEEDPDESSEGWGTSSDSDSDSTYTDRDDVSDDDSVTESEGGSLESEVAALAHTHST